MRQNAAPITLVKRAELGLYLWIEAATISRILKKLNFMDNHCKC